MTDGLTRDIVGMFPYVNPYLGDDTPPPSRRAIIAARKAAFLTEHPLPDPTTDIEGWKNRMGSRIATVCRDKGIVNNAAINQIRDAVLKEAVDKKTYEKGIWLIVRRIITPRVKLRRALEDMHSQGRHKYLEQMFYREGFLDIAHMKEWREYIADSKSDEAALKWSESFLRNNKGNDLDTVMRSMRAYTIQPPPTPTPEQRTKMVDPALAKMVTAQKLCQVCGAKELLSMGTGKWYCPKCKPREESKVTDQPTPPTSELDEYFPRDTEDAPVKHFSQDGKWHGELKKIKNKRRATAMMESEAFEALVKGKCGVTSYKELDYPTGELAIKAIDEMLAVEFDGKPTADYSEPSKSNGEGSNFNETPKSAPTTPKPTPTQISEPQSEPAKKPEPEVVEAQFIEDTHPLRPAPIQQQQTSLVPNTGIASLPMVAQWDVMRQQADVLIKSGFMPQSIRTPEQAITIMMMGSALQIDAIVALNNINVIQGKPTVSPQLMLALVRRSGQLESFETVDDGKTCTVKIKRRNEPMHIETFSQQDAVDMKLAGKDNWIKQPATMRKWRCIAAACRVVFPDVTWGIASYTTEEINPDAAFDSAD